MNIKHLTIFFFYISFSTYLFNMTAQKNGNAQSESAIKTILNTQQQAWNDGDLDRFMNGYWKNDSLKFMGKTGITYGYDATLARYKTSYTDKTQMGQLHFDILSIDFIDGENAILIGKWHLKRTIDDVGGHFSLWWKKIEGEWNIILDHSS